MFLSKYTFVKSMLHCFSIYFTLSVITCKIFIFLNSKLLGLYIKVIQDVGKNIIKNLITLKIS